MTGVPNRIELAPGDTLSLELPGLGTAGFIWQEVVEGDPGVLEVTWERGFRPGAEPGPVGASAPETATLRAVRPGAATLRLVQRRPWETEGTPRSEHTVDVQVRGG